MALNYSRFTRLALFSSFLLHSLGTSYYLPATQMESSEVRGQGSRIEAGVLSGTALSDPTPSFALDDDGEALPPTLPRNYFIPFVGFETALNEEAEIGGRIQPIAGLEMRGKYQLHGVNEKLAVRKSFSISGVLALGFNFGTPPTPYYISTTPEEIASGSSMLYYGKVAFPAGYRLFENHLVLLTPHFTYGGLANAGSLNGSALQFGAGVGWQYENLGLVLRAETGYARGSFLNGVASFYPLGLLVGIKF